MSRGILIFHGGNRCRIIDEASQRRLFFKLSPLGCVMRFDREDDVGLGICLRDLLYHTFLIINTYFKQIDQVNYDTAREDKMPLYTCLAIKYSVSIDEDSNLARAKFDSWKRGGVCVRAAKVLK